MASRRQLLCLAACALPLAPAALAQTYRQISWNELVPPRWDPMKEVRDVPPDLEALQDTDPRAQAFMQRLRQVLDDAPLVETIHGSDVRLPGYVVPLEQAREGLREFLLVPYFGACIHSPPPAANQILLCTPRTPVKGLRSMEAVWVSGRLTVARAQTEMGRTGYALAATSVQKQG